MAEYELAQVPEAVLDMRGSPRTRWIGEGDAEGVETVELMHGRDEERPRARAGTVAHSAGAAVATIRCDTRSD